MAINISSIISELSWSEGFRSLSSVSLFLLGTVVYSLFIFGLYRFISRRDIFKINLGQYNKVKHPTLKKLTKIGIFILENVIFLPFIVFIWFAGFSFLLALMAPEIQLKTILAIAISLIGTIRITAYFNEPLSQEIAKLVPFTLLGVALIDISQFTSFPFNNILADLGPSIPTIIYYSIGIVIIELVLSITQVSTSLFLGLKEVPED